MRAVKTHSSIALPAAAPLRTRAVFLLKNALRLYPFQNETWISNRDGSLFRIGDPRLWLREAPVLPLPTGEHARKGGAATAHAATMPILERHHAAIPSLDHPRDSAYNARLLRE